VSVTVNIMIGRDIFMAGVVTGYSRDTYSCARDGTTKTTGSLLVFRSNLPPNCDIRNKVSINLCVLFLVQP